MYPRNADHRCDVLDTLDAYGKLLSGFNNGIFTTLEYLHYRTRLIIVIPPHLSRRTPCLPA